MDARGEDEERLHGAGLSTPQRYPAAVLEAIAGQRRLACGLHSQRLQGRQPLRQTACAHVFSRNRVHGSRGAARRSCTPMASDATAGELSAA